MLLRFVCSAIVGRSVGSVVAFFLFAVSHPGFAEIRIDAIPVDVELVLAVDVSRSMDPDEQKLQREGYIQALTSQEFLVALRKGVNGRIALTYFEWSSQFSQRVVVPWRLIDGKESASVVADELTRAPYWRASRTSISAALKFAENLFDESRFRSSRRVIHISGDGPNNSGAPVTSTRDKIAQAGIVINGLPVMLKPVYYSMQDIKSLDFYYEDCVIGGPGAFVVPIKSKSDFIRATRTMLLREVDNGESTAKISSKTVRTPRISCTIGETLMKERWNFTPFTR